MLCLVDAITKCKKIFEFCWEREGINGSMSGLIIKIREFWERAIFYKSVRLALSFTMSLFIICISFFISLFLVGRPDSGRLDFAQWFLVLVLVQLFFVYLFKLNKGLWRYSSVTDLILIIKAASSSFIFNILVTVFLGAFFHSLRFVFVDHAILIMGLGGMRLALRYYYHFEPQDPDFKKVLIIGAGDGGDLACRHFNRNKNKYSVMGIIDDDPKKLNQHIHGIKVVGAIEDLSKMIKVLQIDEVAMAIPSATPKFIREVAQVCFEANVVVKVMPPLSEMESGGGQFEIRALKLEDLLSRERVSVDLNFIREAYHGKRVLVTGAAGSIGEELVRQVAAAGPKEVYLLDQAESPLYFVFRDCQVHFPHVKFLPLLHDITDAPMMEKIFEEIKPQIVLHAAAYKHVPLLEENIYQAMMVNVAGTRRLAELSDKHGVERFVFISTDKAVNPTNILGVSKRIAEFFCKVFQKDSKTKFMTVRFGNVIGSQGSVIPLFKKQIEQGGPVTVTHPEIRRYFMMIPEAVQLVLFASVLGEGGEIFVLDMGKQVKILDLAMNMIRICGFEPNRDIKMEFCGLRPGEKLYEELYDETEEVFATKHSKINMAKGQGLRREVLEKLVEDCLEMTKRGAARSELLGQLKKLVSTYQPCEI